MTYVVSGCSNSQKILDNELEEIWHKAMVDYFKVANPGFMDRTEG